MWTRPVQIRATYSCVSAPAGYPELSRKTPVNLAVRLDIPASVRPGSSIILRGTVSIQIPESLRVLIRYWREIDASSDNLTFPVAMNGKTVVVEASRLQTGFRSAKSNPLIVSGVVSTQALQIPTGTTGNIVIDLPHNGTVRSPIDQAPAAFTLRLHATGGPLIRRDVTSHMACSAPENTSLMIASIPVSAPVVPRSA